ncbi:MAG: SDR family oxidoreductase [Phycisphaeraceae bacterium]|nr:MAG: SDR family oxidoreductase [Phycisphaeraceae bacterium]
MKKVALITGAAGGIGRATAGVFAEAGWSVVGVDRRGEAVEGIEHMIEADMADPESPERIFRTTEERFGRLDALVNNAAVQICKPVVETTAAEWDAVMASNLRSVFLSMRYAHPMLAQTKGSIINVSSVHAMATSKNIAAYAASKGALLAFTRAVALEFGADGVRVNAVLPGAVDTPMLHAGLDRGHIDAAGTDELIRGLGRKHVLGRVGRPEEIGSVILFLADGERSSFITGQAMVVDGGAMARLSTE